MDLSTYREMTDSFWPSGQSGLRIPTSPHPFSLHLKLHLGLELSSPANVLKTLSTQGLGRLRLPLAANTLPIYPHAASKYDQFLSMQWYTNVWEALLSEKVKKEGLKGGHT